MKVQILGTGCYNCLKLEMLVAGLLKELNLPNIPVTRVDDPRQIRGYMPEDQLPGLVINGRLVASGSSLPDEADVRTWLSEAIQIDKTISG